MSLKEQILDDIKEAMKRKDDFKRNTLRTLSAALKQIGVDERIELSDKRILKIIASEIKKRKDAIEPYSKDRREDLVQKEQKEIALFESYSSQQLSDEELQAALKEMIANLGVSSLKGQGLVVKKTKAKSGVRADGRRLNVTPRELLN